MRSPREIKKLKALADRKLGPLGKAPKGFIRIQVIHLNFQNVAGLIQSHFGSTPHILGGVNIERTRTEPLNDVFAVTRLDADQALSAEQEKVLDDLAVKLSVNPVLTVDVGK